MPDAIQMPISNTPTRSTALKWLLPLVGLVLLIIHWFNTELKYNNLLFEVNNLTIVPFFETHYLYLYAHLFALIPILCLSFDKKVAFYKEWQYLIPALFIVAVPYWIWDIAKTAEGVWGFNPRYYTFKIVNLPLEEWFFFITFPFASVFIYLCLNGWFPKTKFLDMLRKIDTPLSILLISAFFGIGLWHWGKAYTTTSFWIAGLLLLWQYIYGSQDVRILLYRMFPLATVPFILVNGVFTGGFTEQPIVVYNPEEYLGIRFFTIPVDDFSYNFGLELAVISLYEWFKNKRF
jgi:lycopene cyclase domain-containing protein